MASSNSHSLERQKFVAFHKVKWARQLNSEHRLWIGNLNVKRAALAISELGLPSIEDARVVRDPRTQPSVLLSQCVEFGRFSHCASIHRQASVSGEAVTQGVDVSQQCQTMADQLISTSQKISQIIDQLPDLTRSLDDRRQSVASLWQEHAALGEELKSEMESLEVAMSELEELYGVTVEGALVGARVSEDEMQDEHKNEDTGSGQQMEM